MGVCTCAAGQMDCGPAIGCVDTQSDPNSCGACGNACGPNETCSKGVCTCTSAGQVNCGNLTGCADLSSDPANCGACGNQCAPGDSCVSGQCVCPAGKMNCGGACVDTKTDPLACGDCNTQCIVGDTCSNGQCDCAGMMCAHNGGLVCSDLKTAPADCGACGATCAPAEYCDGGGCLCRPGLTQCQNQCVNTTEDVNNCGKCGNDCTTQGLVNPRCVKGVCVDTTCAALGKTFCPNDGACLSPVDFASDPLHCGSCGNACNSNQVCVAGHCRHYFTSPACNSCPCGACGSGETCCTYPGSNPAVTACVTGNACPQ
jgi:hypothetical protein